MNDTELKSLTTIQNKLLGLSVNDHVEKKKSGKTELTYLSWAWAWDTFLREFPDANYKVRYFDGKPYLFDKTLGYMVFTEVSAGGITKEMWLPVMNGANKAMKDEPYSYFVKGWNSDVPEEKKVDSADMFDINKTIMRCLVKNLAMFGLGLYIYAGEDLPTEEAKEFDWKDVEKKISSTDDINVLQQILNYNFSTCGDSDRLKKMCSDRKTAILEKKQQLGE